jgi:hypothetical protein
VWVLLGHIGQWCWQVIDYQVTFTEVLTAETKT